MRIALLGDSRRVSLWTTLPELVKSCTYAPVGTSARTLLSLSFTQRKETGRAEAPPTTTPDPQKTIPPSPKTSPSRIFSFLPTFGPGYFSQPGVFFLRGIPCRILRHRRGRGRRRDRRRCRRLLAVCLRTRRWTSTALDRVSGVVGLHWRRTR